MISPELAQIGPAVEAGFSKARPGAALTLRIVAQAPEQSVGLVGQVAGQGLSALGGAPPVDMGAATRAANLATDTFAPGLLETLTVGGVLRGLPLLLIPTCMSYSPDVDPAVLGDWTSLAGRTKADPLHYVLDAGTLLTPAIWLSFIAGSGGTLTGGDGQVALGAAGAFSGLGRLLDVLQASQAPSWSCTGTLGVWEASVANVTRIAAFTSSPQVTLAFHLARLPAFPSGDLVPFRQAPFVIRDSGGAQPEAGAVPSDEAVPFFLSFVRWLYAPAQQQLLMTIGCPPVIADSALAAEWRQGTRFARGVAAAGLGRATPVSLYRNVFTGYPPTLDSTVFTVPPASYVGAYLAACVQGKATWDASSATTLSQKLNQAVALVGAAENGSAQPQAYAALWQEWQDAWGFPTAGAGGSGRVPWVSQCF